MPRPAQGAGALAAGPRCAEPAAGAVAAYPAIVPAAAWYAVAALRGKEAAHKTIEETGLVRLAVEDQRRFVELAEAEGVFDSFYQAFTEDSP